MKKTKNKEKAGSQASPELRAKGKTLNVSFQFWEKVQKQKIKHRKRKAEDVLQVIDDNTGESTREKDETLDNTFNSP